MQKMIGKGKVRMEHCLFCKIAAGDIPARIAFQNDELMAFHDIEPKAPTHILVIPKRHIPTFNACCDEDAGLLGRMMLRAKTLAEECGLSEPGYRLALNVNSGGGQSVYHIHLHLLGGRQMTWPPG